LVPHAGSIPRAHLRYAGIDPMVGYDSFDGCRGNRIPICRSTHHRTGGWSVRLPHRSSMGMGRLVRESTGAEGGVGMTIGRAAISRTYEVIRPHVRRTPIIEADGADFGLDGVRLTFKLELLQHSGSFKARGA